MGQWMLMATVAKEGQSQARDIVPEPPSSLTQGSYSYMVVVGRGHCNCMEDY